MTTSPCGWGFHVEQDKGLPLPEVIEQPDSYKQGYRECLQDLLAIVKKDGKDHLVQWAEGLLKVMA